MVGGHFRGEEAHFGTGEAGLGGGSLEREGRTGHGSAG